jgi:hypothetical protein
METYGVVEVQLHAFLTSALDESEWSASSPGRFTSAERESGTHRRGGRVDPRVCLEALKRKILGPYRKVTAYSPVVQPVA